MIKKFSAWLHPDKSTVIELFIWASIIAITFVGIVFGAAALIVIAGGY